MIWWALGVGAWLSMGIWVHRSAVRAEQREWDEIERSEGRDVRS